MERMELKQCRDIYQDAFCTYGIDKNLIILVEECSEVIKASTKLLRSRSGMKTDTNNYLLKKKLTEELADLRIMIEQTEHNFGIEKAVIDIKFKKLARLQERIKLDEHFVEEKARKIEKAMKRMKR